MININYKAVLFSISIALVLGYFGLKSSQTLPDFSVYTNVKEKKEAFFSFMLPLVIKKNLDIRSERQFLLSIRDKSKTGFSSSEISKVKELSSKYRLPELDIEMDGLVQLLNRVDEIPVSMVLAQAAIESAWGTSRFARDANNLFGQWCYKKGCGLVPLRRNPGSKHEVKKFDSVEDAIEEYLHNLNTNSAYNYLREVRKNLRQDNQVLSGNKLAEGLLNYSEMREKYIEEVRAVIRINKLSKHDTY